ncbi:hypothetical protein [Phenylobacterium sp.]|uniref:hypothetical protein n=1 Tax=Phenylobacterium sp. TaxID=1871053 RepID=UPI002BD8C19D|nr:hypothetical protein [Phenylobacterium sp.]HLZ77349.1 hypothetical protein [Phenylobacterium sp.]
MSLSEFIGESVKTRLGVVRLQTSPGPADSVRPLVFALPSSLSTPENFAAVQQRLELLADMCVMTLPIGAAYDLAAHTVQGLTALVGELLESRYPDRPVVLLGASIGAVIALGVRARNLARIVAVEPPLVTAGLWPVLDAFGEHLRQVKDELSEAYISGTFGVTQTDVVGLDHRWVLQGLNVPVDVMLAEEPLEPRRALARHPSLVGEAERRLLAATPGVRLHLVAGTGHNLIGHAIEPASEIVLEACHRASAQLPAERLRLDEPLLEATPLAARRVLHWGPDGDVFAEAYRRLNPKALVTTANPDGGAGAAAGPPGGFDTVVAARPPSPDVLQRLAAALSAEGCFVVRWAAERAALAADLAPSGLVLREPVDAGGTGVVRAQKTGGAPPRPALYVQVAPYTRALMDVRTRMPARGLASDPDLQVAYCLPPVDVPPLAYDAPKLVVMIRPGELRLEVWRRSLVRVIRGGWVTVMDFDDYPPLIAMTKGLPIQEEGMQLFWYAHGVQTSTPALVEHFREYNPETVLFPNPAFELLPFPQGPRPPRVFYGALIRGDYAVSVARSLGPAIESRPETEFVVIGDKEVFAALPTANKRYYEYMSFEAYLRLMSQCTVSLSPVEDLAHWDTKSDGKYIDAARAGVLTIGSPVVYERIIRHGVNGLMARQVADWAPLLRQALTDEPARERMAKAAWAQVRDERMFADQEALRRDWYFDLWRRRDELNEALIARVPGLREALAD